MGSLPSVLPQRKVTLMMIGEDGAGKTSLFQVIAGGDTAAKLDSPAISEAELRLIGWQIKLLDMPGGPGSRALWLENYHRCHGLLFVVDSLGDPSHFPETSVIVRDVFLHPQVAGKPVLMLLNKQDYHRSFNTEKMIDSLSLVPLFRKSKCPCVIIQCSTEPDCDKVLGTRAIKRGLRIHMKNVGRDYKVLCERVQQDTENHRAVAEQIRGVERHRKNGDVGEGSKVNFPVTMIVGNQRSRNDGYRRPEEDTSEYGQLTLPGTLTYDFAVSQSCPIIRRTTIDMGGDDVPEGSVDRSVQVTLDQDGDTLLESGGSNEPLESTHPRSDSARLRDLADELQALCDDNKQVQTEAGYTVSPSDVVYGFAEESVQRLLLTFQDHPHSSTPSTLSHSSSHDSAEVFQQMLTALSTALVDEAMDDLSESSQSSSTDLRDKHSVSSGEDRKDSLGQVQTEKKRKRKINFISRLGKLVKKSNKKQQPTSSHPEDDSHMPDDLVCKSTPEDLVCESTPEDLVSPSIVSLRTGPACGSQVRDKPPKPSLPARVLSAIRKGLRNTFRK